MEQMPPGGLDGTGLASECLSMKSHEKRRRGGIKLVILDEAVGFPRTAVWLRDGTMECFRTSPGPEAASPPLRYVDSGTRGTWNGTTLPLWTADNSWPCRAAEARSSGSPGGEAA